MRCDPDGWETAIADGRWFYGKWRKIKKDWGLMLLSFVLGALSSATKDALSEPIKSILIKNIGKLDGHEPTKNHAPDLEK